MQRVEMSNKKKVIYRDGWYEGEWKNGEFHGQGTRTWSNGKKYIGEWKDGFPNGQGTMTLSDGYKYVGEFEDGKFLK